MSQNPWRRERKGSTADRVQTAKESAYRWGPGSWQTSKGGTQFAVQGDREVSVPFLNWMLAR